MGKENVLNCGTLLVEVDTDSPCPADPQASSTVVNIVDAGAEPIVSWVDPYDQHWQADTDDHIHVKSVQIQVIGDEQAMDLALALESAAKEIRKRVLINRSKAMGL